MKDEILEHIKNPLLKREEVKLIVTADKTPTFLDAAKIISDKFKKNEENIAVKNVKGKFGHETFLIAAHLYNSREDKEKIEPKPKVKKVIAETPIETAVVAPEKKK